MYFIVFYLIINIIKHSCLERIDIHAYNKFKKIHFVFLQFNSSSKTAITFLKLTISHRHRYFTKSKKLLHFYGLFLIILHVSQTLSRQVDMALGY